MISFSKQERIHPCHISRSQLIELINIIKSDFSQSKLESDFTIRTNQEGVNIVEHDTDTFLGNNRLPKMLTRLSIDITGWENSEITKRLSLTLYENFIDLDVTGASETWVNGKFYQVKQYLLGTRPRLWFFQSNLVSGILLGIAFSGITAGISLLIYSFVENNYKAVDFNLVLLVTLFVILNWALISQKYVQIYLEAKQSLMDRYGGLVTIVSLLGSIATVIQLFL